MSTVADKVLQIIQESMEKEATLSKKRNSLKSKTNQIFESKFIGALINDSKSKCKKKKSK